MKSSTPEPDLILTPNKPSSGSLDLIEAGDMGREMGKKYLAELDNMRSSHSRLKGIYYILVHHHQQAYLPTGHYLTFCSMREIPPKIMGSDVWKVNNDNDTCEMIWTLPHRESWEQLKKHPKTDKKLLEFMMDYEEGNHDRRDNE